MKLLIKFPTRGRPAVFRNTLDLYRSKLSGLHNVSFVISIDGDDVTMNNKQMIDYLSSLSNLKVVVG